MSWHLLIIIQSILVAVATVITRKLARHKSTAKSGIAITAAWFVVLYIVGLAILPFFGPVHAGVLHQHLSRFILGGVSFALTNVFTYYMFVYFDAAIGSIISTINTLFTVLGADLFLHESLTSVQVVGAALLMFSVTYGLLATRHKKTSEVHKNIAIGLVYALAAALFFATAAINEKWLLSVVSTGDYLAFGWLFEALGAVFVVLIFKPASIAILKRTDVALWAIALGLIRAVSGLCFILTLVKSNNVGLATIVSNLRLIIIILLGAWLLRERNKLRQKVTASAGALISLTLLFWR